MATTDKPKRTGTVVLQCVRGSFPHLFEPTASVEGGKLKYRFASLMDPNTAQGKANIAKIEAAVEEAAIGVWKTKEKWLKIKKTLDADRRGLQDGDLATNKEGDVYGGYEGMMYITASNGKKPKVIRRDKSPIDSTEAAEIYGGAYYNVILSIWATNQDKHGGNGVFATLELVQKIKDGESFGAAAIDEDDYDELDMAEEEEEDEDNLV